MESDLKPLAVIEDLSKQWIEKMLLLKFGRPVVVHSWSSESPAVPEGFMSEIAYLNIVYEGNVDKKVDLQLVVKVLPTELVRRKSMAEGGLDKREVLLYKFVNTKEFIDLCEKSDIVIQVPEVYYASYSGEDVTLVLKNLTVDNYRSGVVKEGNLLHETKLAVQAIAEFHAAGLAYIKQYGEGGALSTLAEEFNFNCFDYVFGPNLENLAGTYEGTPLAKSMRSLIPYTKDILQMRKRYPLIRTVVHGDYWAGQQMFSEDGTKVMMIDWQHCNVDNPTPDVLSMLFMSSHPEVLENHLEEVLESYWDSLTRSARKVGVSLGITFEQFRKNADDLMLFGFMLVAISIPEFIGGGNLTHERLLGYVNYLEKRNIVSDFVKMMENERQSS